MDTTKPDLTLVDMSRSADRSREPSKEMTADMVHDRFRLLDDLKVEPRPEPITK